MVLRVITYTEHDGALCYYVRTASVNDWYCHSAFDVLRLCFENFVVVSTSTQAIKTWSHYPAENWEKNVLPLRSVQTYIVHVLAAAEAISKYCHRVRLLNAEQLMRGVYWFSNFKTVVAFCFRCHFVRYQLTVNKNDVFICCVPSLKPVYIYSDLEALKLHELMHAMPWCVI